MTKYLKLVNINNWFNRYWNGKLKKIREKRF